MNEDGTMNEKSGKYNGMDRFECRKELVKDLQEAGVLVEIEPHMHSVGHSERRVQLLSLIYQHSGS